MEAFEIITKHGGQFTIEKDGKGFYVSDERKKERYKGFFLKDNKIMGVTADDTIIPIISIPLIVGINRKLSNSKGVAAS